MTQKSSKKSFQIITQNQWSPKPVELTTRDGEGKKERAHPFEKACSSQPVLSFLLPFHPLRNKFSKSRCEPSFTSSFFTVFSATVRHRARKKRRGREKEKKGCIKDKAVAWNMDRLLGYFRETR